MKHPIAVCSDDARSCYDRIVHLAGCTALQQLGAPKAALVSMFISIQKMKHKVRTSYGDSSGYYGDKRWDIPPHGTIQGNGASPLIWAAVSSVLFECLKHDSCVAPLTAPISKTTMHLSGFAFVDNTDLHSTGKYITMEL